VRWLGVWVGLSLRICLHKTTNRGTLLLRYFGSYSRVSKKEGTPMFPDEQDQDTGFDPLCW
jgi:hypothetical protein